MEKHTQAGMGEVHICIKNLRYTYQDTIEVYNQFDFISSRSTISI